jgi:hypothetical protein
VRQSPWKKFDLVVGGEKQMLGVCWRFKEFLFVLSAVFLYTVNRHCQFCI